MKLTPSKLAGERVIVTFLFNASIASVTNPVVTILDGSGADVTNSMVINQPQTDRSKVMQLVGGGVTGQTYTLYCQIDVPATGERFIAKGYLLIK